MKSSPMARVGRREWIAERLTGSKKPKRIGCT